MADTAMWRKYLSLLESLGGTLEEAIANAYTAAKPISFTDMHFRTDIGCAF